MAYVTFTDSLGNTITNYGYMVQIWNYLKGKGYTDNGVAGMMGNLYAESKCVPYICQGNNTYPFSASQTYTSNVNNGTITEYQFVHYGSNGTTAANKGYGLAQWTINARKQPLYTKWSTGGYSSIGSSNLALDYLYDELSGNRANGALDYSNVGNVMRSAGKTIREVSNYVLLNFENPKDKSDKVKQIRYNWSHAIYEYMTQTVTPVDPSDDGSGTGGGGGGGEGKPSPTINRGDGKILSMIRPHIKKGKGKIGWRY